MQQATLEEGFRSMLEGITAAEDLGSIKNYASALIELESGGPKGVNSQWLAEIYVEVKNELFKRGVDIEAGLIIDWITAANPASTA